MGLCDFLLTVVIISNVGSISHRLRDTANFRLKNTHFLLPATFYFKFEHVPLHYVAQILHARALTHELITRVKSFPSKTYRLATIHPLLTDDRQTDKRELVPKTPDH